MKSDNATRAIVARAKELRRITGIDGPRSAQAMDALTALNRAVDALLREEGNEDRTKAPPGAVVNPLIGWPDRWWWDLFPENRSSTDFFGNEKTKPEALAAAWEAWDRINGSKPGPVAPTAKTESQGLPRNATASIPNAKPEQVRLQFPDGLPKGATVSVSLPPK